MSYTAFDKHPSTAKGYKRSMSRSGASSQKGSLGEHGSYKRMYMSTTTQKSRKTARSIRLSDLMAAMYPGIKIGHRFCVQKTMLVPKTMGWLWNTEDTTTGVPFPRGWRPGAVALGVRRGFARPGSVTEPLSTPIGSKGKKIKRKLKSSKSNTFKTGSLTTESCTEVQIPPTLFVKKEGGVYRVMMRPINQLAPNTEQEPVKFKIEDSSASSYSQASKSSSPSIKVEYMCTGALRKPVEKPEVSEMGTQWDTTDFHKKEPEKVQEVKPETPTSKKKKKSKSASVDKTK